MKYETGTPWPAGASRDHRGWNFAVSSAEPVNLVLYCNDEKKIVPMEKVMGNVYAIRVKTDLSGGVTYMFEKDGRLFLDPAARDVRRGGAFADDRPSLDVRCALPEKISRAHLQTNVSGAAVCFHVRGLTQHPSANVKYPGTFEGAVEKLPFFKSLGFEEVILLPVYDFDGQCGGKTNYWGYGRGRFFSPNCYFSAGESGRRSFGAFCREAEKYGMAVTLYMPFSPEFGTLNARMCLLTYLNDYGVKSFILNPHHVNMEILKEDELLAGVCFQVLDDGCMHAMRRFLKGDAGWAVKGGRTFVSDGMHYVTRHTGFTLRDLYTYERKHNEMNGESNFDGPEENYGFNCGVEGESTDESVKALRRQFVRNAAFMTLLSRGKPVMSAEDVLLHSRGGNNNPYCQDNDLTHPDWDKMDREFCAYIEELLDFRREHPLLYREEQSFRGCPPVSFHSESAWIQPSHGYEHGVGIMYTGKEESLLLLLNPWRDVFAAGIPSAPFSPWKKVFSSRTGKICDGEVCRGIRKTVAPGDMEILVSKKRG